MTNWSSDAPSTSTLPSSSSHAARARSATVSNVSSGAISSETLRFACAGLISEVAIRMVTTVGPSGSGANRRYPLTRRHSPRHSLPPPVTSRSNVAWTYIRPAPTDSPLRTSE